jgi:hypothetical protein
MDKKKTRHYLVVVGGVPEEKGCAFGLSSKAKMDRLVAALDGVDGVLDDKGRLWRMNASFTPDGDKPCGEKRKRKKKCKQ